MAHSMAQEADLTCPQCGQAFTAEIWLIVDTAERPDLLEKARQGTLHTLTCPHCGHRGEVDVPLLLCLPSPPGRGAGGEGLLFSPARATTAAQDREQADGLLNALRERLGDAWRDEWLARGLPGVPRDLLPVALTQGLEAAQQQMAEQITQTVKRLWEEDPEAYRRLEEDTRRMAEVATRALGLLERVEEAEDRETFLREHLDEFDDEVMAALAGLAQAADQAGEREAAEGIAAVAAGVLALRLERLLEERPDLREKLEEATPAFAEEEIRRHPLYPLAERVMWGELTLETALQQATAPETLAALNDAALDRMDDHIIALSRDPARPTEARVLAYLLAELNHTAARALPASPPIRAYVANTLGNRIDDYPFKTPAHLERRVAAYQEALAIWQQRGEARRVAMLQNNLGNAYLRLAQVREREANLARAIEAYEQALAMIDDFFVAASVGAQIGLQQEWAGLYARAVEACLQAGHTPQALAVAEGSKSRLLTALLSRGDLPAPSTIPPALVRQERGLAGRLNDLDAAALARHGPAAPHEDNAAHLQRLERRQALVKQLQALWAEMEQRGPEAADYVALRRGDRPAWEDLARLAADLGPHTALLSLFTTGERTLLFVLRAEETGERPGIRVIEVPLASDDLRYNYWANYVDEVLNRHIHNRLARPLTYRWRELGQALLAPALPYLEGITHLTIAPEGPYHLLPLHALDLDGKGGTLLDRFAISYVPALGLLGRLMRRKPVVEGDAVVLGYTPKQEERAVFLGEAQVVAAQMGVEPLLDERADGGHLRQVLRGRALRLVHLSCHGDFAPEDPLRSAVLLADGPFTARQWMDLHFRADLITLSACRMAQAGSLGGDEMAGMSQSLLYAGASSLLVGLWSVNAVTTAYLMVAFYRRLWDERGRKRTDEATALREAALALRDGKLLPPERQARLDTADPYYWAPFVLVGDWR